jgi:hypothetical protein
VKINNIKVGNYASTTRELEHVVTQGSVRSPILFVLYINDLPLSITGSKTVLFVDDTNILVSGKNVANLQYKISNVMTELQMWFKLNNVLVNAEKTMSMSFHTLQNKKTSVITYYI